MTKKFYTHNSNTFNAVSQCDMSSDRLTQGNSLQLHDVNRLITKWTIHIIAKGCTDLQSSEFSVRVYACVHMCVCRQTYNIKAVLYSIISAKPHITNVFST